VNGGVIVTVTGLTLAAHRHGAWYLRENLSPDDLFPDATGASAAELNLGLHDALHLLQIVVEHWHGDHADHRRHSGNCHSEEGDPPKGVSFELLLFEVGLSHLFAGWSFSSARVDSRAPMLKSPNPDD